MASFWFLVALIMAFMASSPFLSLSQSQLNLGTSAISAAPAFLPNPPLLSPDITPLLPSPGGVVPAPTGSSMPTIPANPSPPNPDELVALGPESAVSPSGSLPDSSALSLNLLGSLNVACFVGLVACWSVQLFGM